MMKRNFAGLLLVISLLLLVGCLPSAAASGNDWIDIGGLKIPSTWYALESDGGGPPGDLDISGEGVNGPIHMFFGYGFAGSIEMLIEDSTTAQVFVFDDMEEGYMAEFPDSIIWVRESYSSVTLYHDGNRSVFTDNEDLILKIARSLAD